MTTTSKKMHTSPEAEEDLDKNEQCSRSCIEDSPDIIALFNAEDIVTYVSPSITPVLGYAPEEIMGCHVGVLIHPDDLESIQRMLEEMGQTPGRNLSAEYRLRCKDGLYRWFEGSGTNLLHVPGVGAIVGHFRDITRWKLAPRRNWSEMPTSGHFVQFYETDEFLLDSVSGYISTGLSAGDACIVLATKALREGLEGRLKANGLDMAAACTRGDYTSLDAAETLSKFMIDGLPEPERFAQVVGSMIVRAAKDRRPVRIFGEMVSLLWMEGNRAAAIRLEELWNDLHTTTNVFSLFCAYSMHGFAGEMHKVQFNEICKQHAHVIPDESYTTLTSPDERLRAITLLQQKALSLEAEIAEREQTERRLRLSESRYRGLFEASKDGILLVDPRTGKITAANPFVMELLGYTHEQLQALELWQIGLFESRETTLKALRDVQERQIRYEKLPLQTKAGQHREVECLMNLYKNDRHEVIQCTLHDITERRRAEEALFRLAAIVESSDDAILSKDLDGIITSWNAAAERMYGYSTQEIVGQPVTLLFAADRQDEFTQIMTRIRRGERVDHYETVRVRKDGTFLTVSVTVSPIKDNSGTIIGASAIARDITEQKRLEAKFRQLFESNLIGVFVSDFAGTFLDANDAFLDLLGYTRAELQAGAIQRDALTPAEFHSLSHNAVKALQETGLSGAYEKEYLHKSGKRIPVLIAVTRIEHTETCIGFVLDISERKELDKRKDEFISMASHELKTPVTSLKGFLGLLQRRLTIQEDEKALHYLARMDAQIQKLIKLINDLLDLSKMQTGQLTYREERFEVDALVQEVVESVQETTQTHRVLLEGQTQAEVFGDRDRIGQVLINLLNNAIKYSPQADTVLVRVAKDEKKTVVSVQDFGIGIAKEHQHKIFERFYQVTDPQEKTYPGLGIGLHICREIVKRHGGQLWVESKKGDGATFHVSLPLVEREKSQHAEQAEKNPRG